MRLAIGCDVLHEIAIGRIGVSAPGTTLGGNIGKMFPSDGDLLKPTARGRRATGHACALAVCVALAPAGCKRTKHLPNPRTSISGTSSAAPAPATSVGSPALLQVHQVALANGYTCFIHANGQAWCRGPVPGEAAAGGNVRMLPVPEPVQKVSVWDHLCVLTRAGHVWCAGDNHLGAIGGPPGEFGQDERLRQVDLPEPAADIATGEGFSCAVLRSGHAVCWGQDSTGELGSAEAPAGRCRYTLSSQGPCTGNPVRVSGLDGAVEIGAGESFACARRSDGAVACWGSNNFGQLGTECPPERTCPAQIVEGITHASGLGVGAVHACALEDGNVWCWGDNRMGQLGTGRAPSSAKPVRARLGSATFVETRRYLTCAGDGSRTLCWGYPDLGHGVLATCRGVLKNVPCVRAPTEIFSRTRGPVAVGPSYVCEQLATSLNCVAAEGSLIRSPIEGPVQ